MSMYKSSLVLIIDANKRSWSNESKTQISFIEFINSLKRFIRAYHCMSSGRTLYIIAANTIYCKVILKGLNDYSESKTSNLSISLDSTLEYMEKNLYNIIADDQPDADPKPTLSSSLYIALCYLNRISLKNNLSMEILIIDYSNSEMYLKQHTPLLNIAFSALNMKVPINILTLGKSHSKLLEQLSDITKGIFIRLLDIYENESLDIEYALFQTMLFWFLSSNEGKNVLSPPSITQISNSAVCYCHNNTIEIGFLCSSCLTIYCTDKGLIMCKICRSRFAKRPLKTKSISEINLEH